MSIEGGGGCQCALFGNKKDGDFPGSTVTKIPCSQCRGPGLIPGQGSRSLVRVLDAAAKSLHATTKDPTHHTKTEDPAYHN